MSYPDYTSPETLRLTPVIDAINDLTADINLRISNLNSYATAANGAPITPITLLAGQTAGSLYSGISNLWSKTGVIVPYFMPPSPAAKADLENRLTFSSALEYAGYSSQLPYYGRPPYAEIFIQLKRVIRQLQYINWNWNIHNTNNTHLHKTGNVRESFIAAAYAGAAGNAYSFISQGNIGNYESRLASGTASNIPVDLKVYLVQYDSRWRWETESYDYSCWADFWGLGETSYSHFGDFSKGDAVNIPIIYPELTLLSDPPDGARVSALNVVAIADMSRE